MTWTPEGQQTKNFLALTAEDKVVSLGSFKTDEGDWENDVFRGRMLSEMELAFKSVNKSENKSIVKYILIETGEDGLPKYHHLDES